MPRHALAAALAVTLVGCGAGSAERLSAPPASYLVRLDQLPAPGFTVSEPAHPVNAATLAGDDTQLARTLSTAGLSAAARERFSRMVDAAVANGPVDILETVAAFGGSAGAQGAFTAWVHGLDSVPGAVPMSAGSLGDEAHAVSVQRTDSGVQLVQITVLVRVLNDVDGVTVSGRYGGTRLDDALPIAQRISEAQRH